MPSVPATPPANVTLAPSVISYSTRVSNFGCDVPVLAKGGYGVPLGRDAGRTRQRVLREIAGRHFVRPLVVHGPGMRAVHVEQRAGALVTAGHVAIESAEADGHRVAAAVARQLARRLGDHVDDAGHRVGAPHRGGGTAHDFDLLDLVGIRRHEVPHHHAEEIEVDAAAIDERELRRRERGRGAARRDVDVARRHLGDVDARHRAQQVADVGGRRVLDGGGRDHADCGRSVHELLFGARGGDNDLLLERRRLVGILRGSAERRVLALGPARKPARQPPAPGRPQEANNHQGFSPSWEGGPFESDDMMNACCARSSVG